MGSNIIAFARDFWVRSFSESSTRAALVFLRIYVGNFYIITGLNKVGRGDWGLGYQDSVAATVTGAIENENVYGFYKTFLEGVVMPNLEVFTLLVTWGETFLGFAMLFGISVRLAGYLGAFMAFNYALASGRALDLPSFDMSQTLILLTLGLSAAGRSFGVDQYLAKKWPNAKIW